MGEITSALATARWTIHTPSQVRRRTWASPSPMPASSPRAGTRPPSGRSRGSRARNAALTANVIASIAIAHPGPAHATRAPATPSATIDTVLREIEMRLLAAWRFSLPAREATSPTAAGLKNADPAPAISCRATSVHRCALPVSRSTAVAPWAARRVRSAISMMERREKRSPAAPPSRVRAMIGSRVLRTTMPRSTAEPVRCNTANATASGVRASPKKEAVWPR